MAVALVGIEVHDHHPLHLVLLHRKLDGERDVSVRAEAPALVAATMMEPAPAKQP